MSKTQILYLFTRTPLHVGAGASVGAIDQPVQRERHTGFPIIPASSLKGSFADRWNDGPHKPDGKRFLRVTTKMDEKNRKVLDKGSDAAWLFGSDDSGHAAAGALLFGEARLLAFPIRSAKGSFAWITCPLMLQRASRDGVLDKGLIPSFPKPTDAQPDKSDELAFFAANGPLVFGDKIVLEEYTFTRTGNDEAEKVAYEMAKLFDDPVWAAIKDRLIILSDGMMSFFAQNACEVAQHVRISDETGTAAPGALFNQENVPSETVFYAVLSATGSRLKANGYEGKTAEDALKSFGSKLAGDQPFQFGGDASTGLGYCSVKLV